MKCLDHQIDLIPVAEGGSAVYCPLCAMTVQYAFEKRSMVNDINVEVLAWEQIKKAADQSPWIPKEYCLGDIVADICRFLRAPHNHECHCGTSVSDHGHVTGHLGCVRFITDAPLAMANDMWLVDGSLVTDYTLRLQRGYFQHPCGCWSRSPGSINSLEGDW